jgi:hypothetical protein
VGRHQPPFAGVWGEAPELRRKWYQNIDLFAYKTLILIAKLSIDDVHKPVSKGDRNRSARSLSALPRGQTCQQ